jgi:tRNA(Ile)-lysidine synthase
LVQRFWSSELVTAPKHVLVACSGGPDSMALLHCLARLAGKLPLQVSAAGVDHGLRERAAAELALAAELARALKIEFRTLHAKVAPGGNLQARARAVRYALLEEEQRRIGADSIATGHTADDRAETVLIRLLRGTGLGGLAVLPPEAEGRIRPLLRATREDVELHLQRHSVPFARDPSNLDTRFVRVRVRHELMPLLRELSPAIVKTLNRVADEVAAVPPSATASLALPRAHRSVVEAALKSQKPARFRTSDCKEVLVTLADGAPVLTELAAPVSRPRRPAGE